ncbi:MAG: class I SAM-dependent methyltransferase, partial [Nanoarchaeota archaeon]|nr:class I SAM-dependent methyltransferase [Nanoarchaeota archaeon]
MEKINIIKKNCPICGSKTGKAIIDISSKDFKTKIIECDKCSLIYMRPIISFPGMYDEKYTELLEIYEKRNEVRRKWFDNYLKKLDKKMSLKNKSALDIACGECHLIDSAKAYGLKIVGNELEKSVCESLKKKGYEIICGDITKIKIKQKFDIIFMSQILEHLYEPNKFLQSVKKLLKEDGKLIIMVPNENNFFYRLNKFKLFRNIVLSKDRFQKFDYTNKILFITPKSCDDFSYRR